MKEQTIKLFLKALIYGLLINIGLQMSAEPATYAVEPHQDQSYYQHSFVEIDP